MIWYPLVLSFIEDYGKDMVSFGVRWAINDVQTNCNEILNNAIKEQINKDKRLSILIQNLYDELTNDVKDVTVNLKYGTHHGDNIKIYIKGILIKTKASYYLIVSCILRKLPDDILLSPYQIIMKNLRRRLNAGDKTGYEDIMITQNEFVDQMYSILLKFPLPSR